MKILAICGSLRETSRHAALLRVLASLAPAGMRIELYGGLGDLPLFNPDLEPSDPQPVADLRRQIIDADALVIASPEYAHGITGAMKNALDWMVGNESFMNKPVALINASPRAVHAQAALRETLSTMSAWLVDDACITVPLLGSGLEEHELAAHPVIGPALSAMLERLRLAVLAHATPQPAAAPIAEDAGEPSA
jgi:chromate reductase